MLERKQFRRLQSSHPSTKRVVRQEKAMKIFKTHIEIEKGILAVRKMKRDVELFP